MTRLEGEKPETSDYSYVTYFDYGYIARGIAMIESLRNHGDWNSVVVICLDQTTKEYLDTQASRLKLEVKSLESLMQMFPQLLDTKENRSLIEFYFSLSPFVVRCALKDKSPNHVSIYVDSDMYFFSNPKKIVDDIDSSSVAITRHDFPSFLSSFEKTYGSFNVGLMAFRNDIEGRKVLEWWSDQCIAWCYDYPEDGKYADQGYLNSFPKITKNLTVLENPTYNLAPWNTAQRKPKHKSGQVLVGGQSLTCFHFHGLKRVSNFFVSSQLNYLSPLDRGTFNAIYGTYVSHLLKIKRELKNFPSNNPFVVRRGVGLKGLIANSSRLVFITLNFLTAQVVFYRGLSRKS
jgi:hypothetical protein